MPEYSSTTITPADGVKTPAMNGSTSGNFTLSALRDFILASKGQANGLASLDANGKLPSSQLPDLADDVIVVASYATLPATGTAGKLYITADNNKMYRWDDSLATPDYVELSIDLSDYATKADLLDGTIEPLISTKARQDQNGNVIDQTYETKAEASDLKGAISFNRKRIENLEQKSGSVVDVDYPDYSVYGEVPTGKAKNAIASKLRGVTVAYNEQAINGNFYPDTSNWEGLLTSLSASQNKLTATVVASAAKYALVQQTSVVYKTGHKYLLSCDYDCSGISNFAGFVIRIFADPNEIYRSGTIKGTATVMTSITTGTTSGRIQIGSLTSSAPVINDSLTVANVESYDLTQMFGSQVADYLYSIEQATTGAGVALVKALVKATDLSHETGRLVSTVYESMGSISRNKIDPTDLTTGKWIDATTGNLQDDVSRNATVDYLSCSPNVSYYFGLFDNDVSAGNDYAMSVAWYDINKNFISGKHYGTNNHTVTSPNNAYFFRIGTTQPTYDVIVNVSDANDGTFTPYSTDTLPLPTSVTLRGILKVVNNNLVVDGDEYEPETGEIERNFNTIKLDDYTWTLNSENTDYLRVNVSATIPKAFENGGNINNFDGGGWKMYTTSSGTTENVLDIRDSLIIINIAKSYLPTADASGFNTWCVGKEITYKRYTPTSDTPIEPINDPTLATEGGGTLSTEQTQDPAIVSALEMTYLTL